MTPASVALARSRAYALLGRLFLDGLTPEHLEAVAALAVFQPVLPEAQDEDTRAAAYQTTFGLNVMPFAGVFLAPDGQLGGAVGAEVTEAYRQVGFTDPRAEPEHIGVELAFLAHLTRHDHTLIHQRHFLDAHLLGWLPALVMSIRQEEDPFFTRAAEVALDVVLDHRAALGPPEPEAFVPPPPPPPLLDNPKTGLREVAAYLTHHAQCGLFLSRRTIRQLGRAHRLPGGFGNRALLMTNLLRAAVRYQALPALLDHLRALVDTWAAAYTALQAQEVPGTAEPVACWQARLAATRRQLDTLQSASMAGSGASASAPE